MKPSVINSYSITSEALEEKILTKLRELVDLQQQIMAIQQQTIDKKFKFKSNQTIHDMVVSYLVKYSKESNNVITGIQTEVDITSSEPYPSDTMLELLIIIFRAQARLICYME